MLDDVLDPAELKLFLVAIDYAIATKVGVEFQDYFVDLAVKRWGSDFEPRRPQGKLGDGKCDGFLVSAGRVFQAYAPRATKASAFNKKIKTDFEGAKAEFGSKMKHWTLVHNEREGLPKESADLLAALRDANPDITIDQLGPQLLQEFVLDIPPAKLRILHPQFPTPRDLRRIQFREIDAILVEMAGLDPEPTLTAPTLPPEDKLKFNEFSAHVAATIGEGHASTATFERYFEETSQALRGVRLAEQFKAKYVALRDEGLHPDAIFYALCDIAGGLSSTKERSAGVLGLCAYLFYTCEIFEDAPEIAE